MATPRARAEAMQRAAADPAVSAFVSASAGSGKTKVLVDRLLRLLLGGAAPGRILCLTYTRAAAAEMALRLRAALGRLIALTDEHLDAVLAALGIAPDAALRERARGLFAEVLDLPGGMRIETIHAFCQSTLRRFPLEARISPHFRLLEAFDAAFAEHEAVEAMLADAHTGEDRAALALLAGEIDLARFTRLAGALRGDPGRLAAALAGDPARLAARLRARLGTRAEDEAALLADAVIWPAEATLGGAIALVRAEGSESVANRADAMLRWLDLPPASRQESWAAWTALFLRQDGAPFAPRSLFNKAQANKFPWLADAYAAEQTRIAGIEDQRRALALAAISAALVRLAAPVADAYSARKGTAGLLDYDDLVHRTTTLLVDPGAAWVLYKLDGGLDHLLLDEAQDTAPAQWRIVGALSEEFFAGEGARGTGRTVFAVGDRKQSIFSFQGADPDAFDAAHHVLRTRVAAAGEQWRAPALDVSFRSTAPVLALVDAVFAEGPTREGVVAAGETLAHIADRAGHAGAVALWPLAPAVSPDPSDPYAVAADYRARTSARDDLAAALAGWIRRETSGEVRLDSADRALTQGDVLVLVRRRDAFTRALVRELKKAGVAVAGLDRMVLTAQPAVADLLSLCDALLLPEDDLAVATVLTSPLGGLSDESLMALAVGRRGHLWDALRGRATGAREERAEWRAAWDFLAALYSRVDYASPHALLCEALGPLGGRARLFARFGAEAAEPIDELLNTALGYARLNPPSLEGFVHWLRQSGAEVKREQEVAGRAVRIMTVHAAKGLEAPLVILPDTTALPREDEKLVWLAGDDGAALPVFAPRKELRCDAAEAALDEAAARRREEYNRLLYVALTRARDRLVICGWQPRREMPATCWYRLVETGFALLPGVATMPAPLPWSGAVRCLTSPQYATPERAARPADQPVASLPGWVGRAPHWQPVPPPAEPAPPRPLAPSRPEGVAFGTLPAAVSPLEMAARGVSGRARGLLVHALLRHLPDLPPAEREAASRRFLAGHALPPTEAARLTSDALAILDHPELAPLYGPAGRAEVPLSGVIGGRVIGGLVDRLAVLPGRVLIADYKTNRDPPRDAEAVPLLYLRQMAAYRAVLRAIFPDRATRCALVWTRAAAVMTLPDALLDPHAPAA